MSWKSCWSAGPCVWVMLWWNNFHPVYPPPRLSTLPVCSLARRFAALCGYGFRVAASACCQSWLAASKSAEGCSKVALNPEQDHNLSPTMFDSTTNLTKLFDEEQISQEMFQEMKSRCCKKYVPRDEEHML